MWKQHQCHYFFGLLIVIGWLLWDQKSKINFYSNSIINNSQGLTQRIDIASVELVTVITPSLTSRLVCSHETPPEGLCPRLQSTAQKRHGFVGVGPDEGHEDDLGAGAPFLQRQAERIGTVQSGEDKAPGRAYCSLSVLEGHLQERWTASFQQVYCDRTRGNLFKLKKGRFRLDRRKRFFTIMVMSHWNRLPRAVWVSHSQKWSGPGCMRLWETWYGRRYPHPWKGDWKLEYL